MFLICLKRLRSLFCALIRFVRTWTTLFCRVLSSSLRQLYPTHQINMESDGECEFDSTWEDESENIKPNKTKKSFRNICRNMYAAKDTQKFRHSCRNLDDDGVDDDDDDDEHRMYNLDFYKGRIRSSPDDIHIEEFHQQWLHNYELLEDVHSYIQWLFPLQERGVNWSARVLTKKEIQHFRRDEQAKSKLMKSYELMLDFYGIRLVNKDTGEVERAPNWKDRFENLNSFTHNNLRITRILKCLGTLGLQHFQTPLVKFFLHETLVNGELQRVKQSVLDYFIFVVLDKSERQDLVRYAYKHFKPRKNFVWGPEKILQKEEVKESEQERVKPPESTHEMCKKETSPPPEGMGSKKSHNKDRQEKSKVVTPHKSAGTKIKSEQKENGNSQCSVEVQNQEMCGDGNDDNITPANMPQSKGDDHGSNLDEIDNPSKNDVPVIPNKTTNQSIISNQGANYENNQYSSKAEKLEKQCQAVTAGDNISMTSTNMLHSNYDEHNLTECDNPGKNEEPGCPDNLNNQCNSENGAQKIEQNQEMDVDIDTDADVEMTPANMLLGKVDGHNLDERENPSKNEMPGSPDNLNKQHNVSDQGASDDNNQWNSENGTQKIEQNQEMDVDVDGDGHNLDESENPSKNEMPGSPDNLNKQNNVSDQGQNGENIQ